MEAGMQIELYKIDNKRNIIIVTIKEITDELRKQIDKYICRIWAGQNEKDIKYVKKEILEYIEKKIGASKLALLRNFLFIYS